MAWRVAFTGKAAKQVKKMPQREQDYLALLARDLRLTGPAQPSWPNYSKLGKNEYHCHLSYRWVACWRSNGNELELIEIYYAGSRENAPYG
jgi:mRNA-degrading endonuclease RelE of RelBE toxin-antitoxin system